MGWTRSKTAVVSVQEVKEKGPGRTAGRSGRSQRSVYAVTLSRPARGKKTTPIDTMYCLHLEIRAPWESGFGNEPILSILDWKDDRTVLSPLVGPLPTKEWLDIFVLKVEDRDSPLPYLSKQHQGAYFDG